MDINALPRFDDSVNTTGCCPRFNPEGWDGQDLHLRDVPVVRAATRSVMHIPLNMGSVFTRVHAHIKAADACDPAHFLVLSEETSPWSARHHFFVNRPVPGEEMATLSGDFVTRVFEGPYSQAKAWHDEMQGMVRAGGHEPGRILFFYTTCPKCAKAYGQNYVVGVAEVTRVPSAVL